MRLPAAARANVRSDRSLQPSGPDLRMNPLRVLWDFGRLSAHDLPWFRQGRGSDIHALDAHLHAALKWLCVAQDVTGTGGFSHGYSARGGWRAPYRETTGYIIPTFLRAAARLQRPDLKARAFRAADWLLSVQSHDGSICNPDYGSSGIVFDTGQVLFGFVSAYRNSADPRYLEAALRAGNWLVDVADPRGLWTRNEHFDTAHVYNTRTAWALLTLEAIASNAAYTRIARANLDWALSNQLESGLFSNAAFRKGDSPYTHNISYTICGLQESGWLLGDAKYCDAARRAADACLQLLRPDGSIPGQISPDTKSLTSYTCLTGNCQLAIVWSRLFGKHGERAYQDAARQALAFAIRHQNMGDAPASVAGAIAGSFPIWGRYAPLSFPNWATKFLVDAALLQRSWTQP
jgi:uncharacterized protein YyaL (SSP411 family)